MPRSVLDIILNLKKTGTGAKQAKQEMSGVEKAVRAAGKALVAFGGTQAVRASYDLAKLGAQAMRTETAFQNISGSADEASARLEAMMSATRGALTETEAMASANQLMQMGLADSADELDAVATMAVKLGTAMGRDANQSLEEFALLLANQSIPRLDTFGISAGRVRTRINELRDANEDMTREAAFMQATMEAGRESMDRLGEGTEDAALSFERAEAKARQARIEIGQKLVPAWAGFLDLISTGIDETGNITKRLNQGGAVMELWAIKTFKGTEAAREYYEENIRLRDGLDETEKQVELTAEEIDDLSDAIEYSADRWGGYGSGAAGGLQEADEAISEHITMLDEHDRALGRLEAGLSGDVSRANRDFAQEQADIKDQIDDAKQALQEAKDEYGPYSDEVAEAQGKLSDLRGELGQVKTDHRETMNSIIFDMLQARAAVDGYSEGEIEMLGEVGRELGVFDEKSSEIWGRVMGYYEENIDAAGNWAGETEEIAGIVVNAMGRVTDAVNAIPMHRTIKIDYDIEPVKLPSGETVETPTGDYAYQSGTPFFPGGWAMVGEGGPEMVRLPRGSEVIRAAETRNIINDEHNYQGDTYHVSINDRLAAALWMEQMRQRRVAKLDVG